MKDTVNYDFKGLTFERLSDEEIQHRKKFIEDYEQKLKLRDRLDAKVVNLDFFIMLVFLLLFLFSFIKCLTIINLKCPTIEEFNVNLWSIIPWFVMAIITGLLLFCDIDFDCMKHIIKNIIYSTYRVDEKVFQISDLREKYVFYKEMLQVEQFLHKHESICLDSKNTILPDSEIWDDDFSARQKCESGCELNLLYMYSDENKFVYKDYITIKACSVQYIYLSNTEEFDKRDGRRFSLINGVFYIPVDGSGLPLLKENEKTLTLKGGETDVKSIRSDCRQAGTDG